MSSNKKERQYNQKKDYTIYVILHPHTKEFFVHYATTSALRNAMKDHYTLKNSYTKDMFKEHKETIYPPEMYALEENEMTAAECYEQKIIWIKYFVKQNYIPLNHEDDVSSSENLFEENIAKYKKIESLNINETLCKANRRFPHYGRERIELTDEEKINQRKQMKFYCTEEEYEVIKHNANERGQTVSAFIRDVSINTVSISFNYDAIIEHTKLINQIKTEMNAVITMLVQTNQAFPIDIEKMINLLHQIDKTEKNMLQKTQKERQQIRKDIKNLIANKE